MGDVYSLEGNLEKSEEAFRRAISLRPDYADAYHNLANTFQRMGKPEPAIVNYEKAVSLNPGLWQSYQSLGMIYFHQGRLDMAGEYFKKALKINPDEVRLKLLLKELERN